MSRKQIINGKVYSWSSVTIDLSGCSGIEPLEISYDQSQEKSLIHGKGGRVRGFGTGKKDNSMKLSLLREDFNILNDAYKNAGGVIGASAVIPKITVSYADEGCTTTVDTLTNVIFTKESFKAADGDNSIKVDLEGMCVGGITHE